MAIRNWSFRWKILLIVGTLLAGMTLSLGLGLQALHRELVDSRHDKVRQLVEVAHDVIARYAADAKAGRLSEAAAKTQALEAVKGLRYNKSEYFWINDLSGRMVMHPIKPELDGKNLLDFKDPSGKRLFAAMVDVVRTKNEGFVDYLWPKPGFDKPVPKISFVKGVEGWDWLVGSGIYLDDVQTAFWQQVQAQAVGTCVTLLVALLVTWLLGRDMIRAMSGITAGMNRLVAGDTSAPDSGPERGDEFGAMQKAVSVFRDNAVAVKRLETEQAQARQNHEEERRKTLDSLAHALEQGVSGTAEAVSAAAVQLRAAATAMTVSSDRASETGGAVAQAAEQASHNVEAVAAAAEELSASIDEIGRRVEQSSTIADEAVEAVRRTDGVVRGLSEGASRIGQIVGLINEIASQTNLLALNATIEAARAGDAGKGFAVVAGEVKHLAAQTARATDEISSQIGGIQATSGEAVRAIRDIGATIERMSGISSEISLSVNQQGEATREIAQNVGDAATRTQDMTTNMATVNRTVGETGSAAREVLSAADRLAHDSDVLKQEVTRFLTAVRGM